MESLATLYVNRAECHRQLVDMRRVVEDCELALQLVPRSFKAHLRRALAMEYLEKYDAAAAGFKAALALDPSGTVASQGLGRVAAYKEVDGCRRPKKKTKTKKNLRLGANTPPSAIATGLSRSGLHH